MPLHARVGFKCRLVSVNLREIYLILIEVPHLKQRLKATNLMSVFDYKIENEDNQVILAMIERWWPTTHTFLLPCGELGITPRDFTVPTGIGIGTGEPMEFDESSTDYGNAIRVFPDMMPTEYEKGCISFAHLRTYLDNTRVNIRDPANANTIFRAFMLLYVGGVLFGNSKSWARLELLCPITILENKAYTIDFGSAILGHLYYCLDQASKLEVKYIDGLFQLIEYHCYEYCQIGHHIFIDNRLDDFWPRMSAWQTKSQKVTGNKAKNHLALMRQQLDLRTINNMQWDPFRNMKDALKWEFVPSEQRVGSKHNIIFMGHHVDYDAYWRHVSHGALMSDIARRENIDISGLGTLTSGVTFPHVEFPTVNYSTQETQILPPQLGDYPG
ncbi:hypothetical protein GIB67_008145 [Kingdonia uniflora]|uniref:Aminotransferase-like plant mobile domain-containing protein n=1 Tax=Kingdonia uniflora TaxID=39325 RepID=A0A7J7MSZ8_9MAGN|nr:hypothetical protein GIB67_008145 [Kingdonia uniflora]